MVPTLKPLGVSLGPHEESKMSTRHETLINGRVSHWWEQLGGASATQPRLPGSISADVAIVGAGYTGLWTAYYL